MYVTAILIFGGILLTLGDIVFKYYAGHHSSYLYVLGLGFYIAGLLPLIESYKYANIELASALLVIFNIIILTVVGWLYFKEQISALELLGLAFAGLAILCLELSG